MELRLTKMKRLLVVADVVEAGGRGGGSREEGKEVIVVVVGGVVVILVGALVSPEEDGAVGAEAEATTIGQQGGEVAATILLVEVRVDRKAATAVGAVQEAARVRAGRLVGDQEVEVMTEVGAGLGATGAGAGLGAVQ